MKLDIKELLKEFDYCDEFSLVLTKNIFSILENDKQKLLNKHLLEDKNFLYNVYCLNFENKEDLPEFENLYKEIFEECKNFYTPVVNNNYMFDILESYSPFISEHIKLDTKFTNPYDLIKTFYSTLQNYFIKKIELDNLKNQEELLENLLDNDLLNKNFIKKEYVFEDYNKSSNVNLVCYFKLNDVTKNYLLQSFENDKICNGKFENLKFYKNGIIEN